MNNWYLEIDLPTIIVFVSAVTTLALQLLLCFMAKKLFVKLLPAVLLIVSTIVFSICSASINGWDGLGYLFFALLSFGLLIVCGLAWVAWAFIRKNK